MSEEFHFAVEPEPRELAVERVWTGRELLSVSSHIHFLCLYVPSR